MDRARLEEYHATRDYSDKAFRSSCYAAHVSMYFDTLGNVLACCQNAKYPVGNVTQQRLPDIWHGPRIATLRKALKKDSFGAGCQFCEWQISVGNYLNAFTRNFDIFPVESESPDWPRMMEFSVSNTCNLECIMCYGILSSSIRARREGLPPLPKAYGDEFFSDLRPFLHHLRFAKFLGGEPFLAAESFRVWDTMLEEGVSPHCHVTTNGTQWNNRVEHILERFPIGISISMDGATKETVESIRVNAKFEMVRENFRRFHAYSREKKTDLTLTYCLMRQNWHEFGDYLLFADEWNCQVGVNLVREPPQCSLYTLPISELAEITKKLEKQGETLLPRLGLNHKIWIEQVSALRNRVDHADESARTPFETPLALVVLERPKGDPESNQTRLDSAVQKVREWAGPEAAVVTIESDPDDRIRHLQSADDTFFGVPASDCLEQPFPLVVQKLSAALGPYRPQQIDRSVDSIDRGLLFQRPDGTLLAIRTISVPTFNEFGLAAGSIVAAASKTIPPTPIERFPNGPSATLKEWGPNSSRIEIDFDASGRIRHEPLFPDSIAGPAPQLRIGMNEAEAARAMVEAWGHREHVHGVAEPQFEDIQYRYRGKADLWATRQITVPYFESGRHVGYRCSIGVVRLDQNAVHEVLPGILARLEDWSGNDQVLQLTLDRADRVTGLEGAVPECFGLTEATCKGISGNEILELLVARFGAEQLIYLVATPETRDAIIEFSSKDGHYALRGIDLPHFNAANHYVGTVRLIAATAFQRKDYDAAIEQARKKLAEWSGGQDVFTLTETQEGLIQSIDGPGDSFLGIAFDAMRGVHRDQMQGLLFGALGEPRMQLWEQRAHGLDVILDFAKPGQFTSLRAISIPCIDEAGACVGMRRMLTGVSITPETYPALEAKAIERLRQWIGTDAIVRVIESRDSIVQRVEAPMPEYLEIPLSSLVGRSIAELDCLLAQRFGPGQTSRWIQTACWLETGRDYSDGSKFATGASISIPYVVDDASPPAMLRMLTGRRLSRDTFASVVDDYCESLKEWSASDQVLRMRESAQGIGIEAQTNNGSLLGLKADDIIGADPAELAGRMQERWGELRVVSQTARPFATDIIVEFLRPDQKVLVRNILLPDLEVSTNAGGHVRLVAAKLVNDVAGSADSST